MTYPTCPSCGGWGYLGARNDAVITTADVKNRQRILDQAVRDVTDRYDRNCFMAADQDHDRTKCQECVELVARIRQRYARLMDYENRDQ